MAFEKDDIRAAVSAGLITEEQAASLLALAEERAGKRAVRSSIEEPFELFKGFNEIFIVIGLSILFAGWLGITGLSVLFESGDGRSVRGLIFALISLLGLAAAARYFTLKRRMVAPSIALTIMWLISSLQVGRTLGDFAGLSEASAVVVLCAAAVLSLGAWYAVFRIPFTMALLALSVFGVTGAFFVLQGAEITSPADLFLLTNDGPFAILTIVLGLIGFGVAMWFDMSDPHRISRRSASGFWLHIIAAPAIINTIALTLFEIDTGIALLALLVVLCFLALVAVVIDRRSFLVAGIGYVVALAFTVIEIDNAFWVIFALGILLLGLGAKWEQIRGTLLRALPSFPGKTNLPPYALTL